MILELNEINYSEFIENDLVVVDIYADWCGPCKMISPVLEEISIELPDVKIGKLNVESYKDILTELGVRSIPTILFYKDGVLVDRNTGLINKSKLISFIEKYK